MDGSKSMSDRKESFSEIDEFFIGITSAYSQLITKSAEESMSQVLSACTELVGDNARTALEDFKKLYFGGDDIAAQSTAVNEVLMIYLMKFKANWQVGRNSQ